MPESIFFSASARESFQKLSAADALRRPGRIILGTESTGSMRRTGTGCTRTCSGNSFCCCQGFGHHPARLLGPSDF